MLVYHYSQKYKLDIIKTGQTSNPWNTDIGWTKRCYFYDSPDIKERYISGFKYICEIDINKIYDIASNKIPYQTNHDKWFDNMKENGYIGYKNSDMDGIMSHVIVSFVDLNVIKMEGN